MVRLNIAGYIEVSCHSEWTIHERDSLFLNRTLHSAYAPKYRVDGPGQLGVARHEEDFPVDERAKRNHVPTDKP
jgi:hypothetical protein